MKKSKQNKKDKVQKISRFHPKPTEGLTSEQVKKRIEENLVNDSSVKTNKSVGTILFKNIFTFFNMTCLVVALALISYFFAAERASLLTECLLEKIANTHKNTSVYADR